mgnify:CR=1 FL=1
MRHSTPCGVQAHACTLIPLPEARIGSVLPRIVPESGSVLKEGGQLVRSSAARCVEEQGVRRLPAARRRARGQAAEVIDLGSGAHVGLRKEEEEESRVLPRALAEALQARLSRLLDLAARAIAEDVHAQLLTQVGARHMAR